MSPAAPTPPEGTARNRRHTHEAPSEPSSVHPLERESQKARHARHRGDLSPTPDRHEPIDPLADAAFTRAEEAPAYATTQPEDLEPKLSQRWLHAGWRHTRAQVYDSLIRTGQPAARLESFATCGSTATLLQSRERPDEWKIVGSRCHDRFCLRCATARARAIAYNVVDYLKNRETRFLTLTVRSTGQPLAELLDHLTDSFRKLRRRRLWRRRVTGGVAFLEIKWSEQSQQWHPHFHVLITGKYVDWQDLRAEWWRVTGDSHVIDIRAIKNEAHAFHYVAKYASKPLNNTFAGRPARLDECVTALRGRKLAHTFGDCRGLVLIEKPEESGWEPRGTLEDWIARARAGDQHAADVLLSLAVTQYARDVLQPELFDRPPPTPAPVAVTTATNPVTQAQLTLFRTRRDQYVSQN